MTLLHTPHLRFVRDFAREIWYIFISHCVLVFHAFCEANLTESLSKILQRVLVTFPCLFFSLDWFAIHCPLPWFWSFCWFSCESLRLSNSLYYWMSDMRAQFDSCLLYDLIILYLCYGVLGAGASCVFLSGFEIVRKCFDKRRSIALGITSAGQGIGTMALSQVLQSLVNALSWRNSLRIVAGALALNSFFGLLYDSKMYTTSNNEMLSREEVGERPTSKRFTFHWSVWKVPGFLLLTIGFFFVMFGRSVVYVHLVSAY